MILKVPRLTHVPEVLEDDPEEVLAEAEELEELEEPEEEPEAVLLLAELEAVVPEDELLAAAAFAAAA